MIYHMFPNGEYWMIPELMNSVEDWQTKISLIYWLYVL
jgi:hypothetical protein